MRIGEVSKYLGLSPETIRYYEMEGLISPNRNPDSSYRDYRAPDVLCLMAAQRYRSMGFSLKEVETILNSSSIEEQYHYVNTQYHILRDEMNQRRHLLDYLCTFQSELASAAYNVGNFWVHSEEASYLLPVAVRNKKGIRWLRHHDEDELPAWLAAFPFYNISLAPSGDYRQKASGDGRHTAPHPAEHLICLHLSESDFQNYSLEKSGRLIYRPAGMYLHTVLTFDFESDDIFTVFPDSLNLPDLHGLSVSGDACGKLLIFSHDYGKVPVYLELQIPLTEKPRRQ